MNNPHLRFPLLLDLGLNETEAHIYEALLNQGPMTGSKIAQYSGIGRGNVYNAIQTLKTQHLVTEKEGKIAVFEAAPPSTLENLLNKRKKQVEQLSASFSNILPLLSSDYRLSTGKPVIQVFEGLEGLEKALDLTLESKTEICTYVDLASISKEMTKINKGYLKKRLSKGINKKLIVEDTVEARNFFIKQASPLTEVAYLKNFPKGFASSMQLFDDTVIYLTLTEEKQISVVIRDANIYAMHKGHFNYLWGQAAFFSADAGSSSKTT